MRLRRARRRWFAGAVSVRCPGALRASLVALEAGAAAAGWPILAGPRAGGAVAVDVHL
jgi:hypothetical protein